jgi:hypothetical protein
MVNFAGKIIKEMGKISGAGGCGMPGVMDLAGMEVYTRACSETSISEQLPLKPQFCKALA